MPLSGVTSSGRVWRREVGESHARSVSLGGSFGQWNVGGVGGVQGGDVML